MITKAAQVKKAIGGAVAGAVTGVGTLVSLGLLSGSAKDWVLGLIAAATPLLVFAGVYKSPPNAPTVPPTNHP